MCPPPKNPPRRTTNLEAMVKTIVETLGPAPHEAFGFAVFSHMVMYGVVTMTGMIFLYRVGLSLAGLKAALKQKK